MGKERIVQTWCLEIAKLLIKSIYILSSQSEISNELKELAFKIQTKVRRLQRGRGVRRGDHFPPHKYIKTTSTCGTTPTEHLLNAGRRPQTSQKARNSPRTWVGQKKKGKTETKEQGRDLHLGEGAVKEEKFPHTRKPLHWWRRGVGTGGASEPQRRAQQ